MDGRMRDGGTGLEPALAGLFAAVAAAGVQLRPLHSFDNAAAIAARLGWQLVKGFVVLERLDCSPGTSFVALRHWWNAKPEGAVWADLTPSSWSGDGDDTRRLLVESPLGDKQPSTLSAPSREFAVALAARLAAGLHRSLRADLSAFRWAQSTRRL